MNAVTTSDLESLNESLQIDALESEQVIERKQRQYGFMLAGEKLFFENTVRRELFEKIVIKKIPLMPNYILGLCNVRGNLVPVYDLAKKYGLKSNSKDVGKYKVLVISDGIDMVGFVVDEMLIAVDFYDDDLLETEVTANEAILVFIKKSFLIHDEPWHQIDHNGLFDSLACIQ